VPAGPDFIPLQSFLGEFAEITRLAFVTVTVKVFSIADGNQAISKISVIPL